jgi:hypothetical protein
MKMKLHFYKKIAVLQKINFEGEPERRWRFDGMCGAQYPLPDGGPTECDPDGYKPCCSHGTSIGWNCASFRAPCTCLGCIDYQRVKKWRNAGDIRNFIPY